MSVSVCVGVCDMVAMLTAAMRQGEWRGNIPYREGEGGRGGRRVNRTEKCEVCVGVYAGECEHFNIHSSFFFITPIFSLFLELCG